MPKKTTILIIILALVTAGLVYLALKSEQAPFAPSNQQNETTTVPTQTVEKTATLSFSPETMQAAPGVNTADIILNSNGKPVTGAQIELEYDPKVVQNVEIIPAQDSLSFFGDNTSSLVLFNETNEELGRVSYAIALNQTTSGKIGEGTVGRISFTLSPTHPDFTMIRFLDKSLVSVEGESESVLNTTTPLLIRFNTTPTAPAGQ